MTWAYVFMYRFMQMHLSSLCTQMYVFLFMSERGATGCNHVSMSCWMTIVFSFLIEVALVTIGPMCVYEALI